MIEGKKLTLDMPLFVDEVPDDSIAFSLRAGAWKFDFDKKSRSEIDTFLAEVDGRPRMCSAIFPSFASFRVVEFGPADGYNTAQLEQQGVKSIVAIEANADNFIKCLIMKNAFNLDAKFLLGNFLKYLENDALEFDLAYASGVLYHLPDPVGFIERCAKFAKHIFIWTLYYDDDVIKNHSYENKRFVAKSTQKSAHGEYTYYARAVDGQMLGKSTYQGGIVEVSNWMSIDDIRRLLRSLGYTILMEVPDSNNNIPAMNIFASRF